VELSKLGIEGPVTTRDLWRQKDLGRVSGRYEAEVPRHGVMLVRLAPAK